MPGTTNLSPIDENFESLHEPNKTQSDTTYLIVSQSMPKSVLCSIASILNIGKVGNNALEVNKPYRGANLYVFRYQLIEGEWVIKGSKPCAHCIRLIKKAGIKKVFYSDSNGKQIGVVSVTAKKLENNYVTSGSRKKTIE